MTRTKYSFRDVFREWWGADSLSLDVFREWWGANPPRQHRPGRRAARGGHGLLTGSLRFASFRLRTCRRRSRSESGGSETGRDRLCECGAAKTIIPSRARGVPETWTWPSVRTAQLAH
jgi:hypothetical protein